jgi:translation initiation factor IF-2
MSETKEQNDKTPGSPGGDRPKKTLALKRTEAAGQVRQSMSHGRTRQVVVEKTTKRTFTKPGSEPPKPVVVAVAPAPAPAPAAEPAVAELAPIVAQVEAPQASPAPPAPAAEAPAPVAAIAPVAVVTAPVATVSPVAAKGVAAPATPATPAKAAAAAPAAPRGAAPRSAASTRSGAQPSGRPSAASGAPRTGNILRSLSQDEQAARLRALEGAKIRDVEDQKRAAAEAIIRVEREVEEKRVAEEEARKRAIEEAEHEKARELEAKRAAAEGRAPVAQPPLAAKPTEAKRGETRPEVKKGRVEPEAVPPRRNLRGGPEEEDDRPRKAAPGGNRGGVPIKRPLPERAPAKRDEARVRGRLTITNAFDDSQRERSLASWKRQMERQKAKASGPAVREKIQREVIVPEAITIQELANRMAERGVDIIKFLMKSGEMQKITDVIDADTADLIVQEFGHTVKRVSEADVEEGFIAAKDVDVDLQTRAPVVTIMGHVDHGKTSLLDAIRQTNVVSGEAGGITQHIGAYQVETGGRKITFIDTPGHEAFTAMRARGAKVTDIVVLVVAADDGVMPQTIEAINHAKAAKVPLIVAINKIDKPNVDATRVRTDLLSHEVVVESMSGETLEVEVSALKRLNLDKLLEAIALQSELLDLKSNPNRSAEGVVIEAKLESGRGPVGTVLIQRGTLRVGDIIVAGTAWGRVRALQSDRGESIKEAGPSVPVEVLGFSSAPEAGDQLAVVENEGRAREITDYRVRQRRNRMSPGMTSSGGPTSLEQMMTKLKEQGRKEFPLVVKGDVQGSVEAINAALNKLGNEEVSARIIHWGVGGITESDVSLAATSGAVLCAFNVRANVQARALAERNGVEIRQYSIIYDLVDDIKLAMSGLLAPTIREVFLGNAKILQIFDISKVGKVAGCQVTEGKVERGAKVRLIRDNVVIHEGKLSTLKRFKDEVREVPAGQECGMAFEAYKDMREGDVIECFNLETIQRSL